MKNKQIAADCELCVYYVYDEDDDCYSCLVNLDEDEYISFLQNKQFNCPYFKLDDEYGVVRHQN